MSAKLTQWFPSFTPPTKIGEYRYKYDTGYQFHAYWNGNEFLIHDRKHELLWDMGVSSQGHWRGLAEKP